MVGLLSVLLAGCGSSGGAAGTAATGSTVAPTTARPASAPTSATASTTTPTTVPVSTTVQVPPAPQSSPTTAAATLMSAWRTGERALAGRVAVATAVADLFAAAYPPSGIISRGCTDPVSPATCTYADEARTELFEIVLVQVPAGWYVSAATPET